MNVEEVQRRLWKESLEHKEHRTSTLPMFPTNPYDKRIRKLMDLMHNPTWLMTAAQTVLANSRGKKAGIDKVSVTDFEKNLEANIEEIRLELKHGTYQPKPVRQVLIPKANGKMRALGIPCLRDKIVQQAIKMALEPILEVEFHESSFGFRPNRSTHQAVSRCRILMQLKFSWVIEGDVKACFDEISHKSILKVVREKVLDNKFIELIQRFLKAGVSIDGKVQATERGVPQGGVISPLLANAVLNKLDWFLHEKGSYDIKALRRAWYNGESNLRFVRYADDWCVFLTRSNKRQAEKLRQEIAEFLGKECGLQLSMEKTKVTHVREGFNFLGFNLLCGVGKKGTIIPKIKIGQKAIQNLRERLNREARCIAHQTSIAARIFRMNLVLRGWGNYFCAAHNFKRIARKADNYAFWTIVKAICRKEDISTAQCLKKYYRRFTITVGGVETLIKLSKIDVKTHISAPEPYIPGGIYEVEDDEDFAAALDKFREQSRPGTYDLKIKQLEKSNFHCANCQQKVTMQTAQLDHIVPIKKFPSFKAANSKSNLQILCNDCHKRKHAVRKTKRKSNK